MVHIEVTLDTAGWRHWGHGAGLAEDVTAFIGFRPDLLMKMNKAEPAWCSPRSWAAASELHRLGLPIDAAVGVGAAREFAAYVHLKESLPALEPILSGGGGQPPWPEELSLKWAVVSGVAFQARTVAQATAAFQYLDAYASAEWVSLFLQEVASRWGGEGRLSDLAVMVSKTPRLSEFVDEVLEIVA
jgi:hypothetical protein